MLLRTLAPLIHKTISQYNQAYNIIPPILWRRKLRPQKILDCASKWLNKDLNPGLLLPSCLMLFLVSMLTLICPLPTPFLEISYAEITMY